MREQGAMMRAEFLAPLIGEPWAWQSRNCWDFACHVQGELFGRELPRVAVPADLSKRWILESIEAHPERSAWREVPDGPGGLVTAADGALVLMAHLRFPAHIGVWLQPEARVIHCSEQHGVCCESVLSLRQMGWKKLSFFEPISQGAYSSTATVGRTSAQHPEAAQELTFPNQRDGP